MTRRRYTARQVSIARASMASGITARAVSREMGIPLTVLHSWTQERGRPYRHIEPDSDFPRRLRAALGV